jgi:tight adherence protein B
MRLALASVVFSLVLLAVPSGGGLRRLDAVPDASTGSKDVARRRYFAVAIAVVAGVTAAAAALSGRVGYALPLVALVVVVGAVRRLLAGGRARRASDRRRRAVVVFCDHLSAEMRAGLPAVTALERSCRGTTELATVVATARLGGDVADAFRTCAGTRGYEGLRAVAGCWEVAASAGTGLATALDRIAASLRVEQEARSEVQASLGPPRATAKLLAVLPAFGMVLGSSIGGRPLHFLLQTSWGLGCLSVGALLAIAGLCWVEALAAAVES